MAQALSTLSYHAGLYVIADIMQRGIAFLLIPLYTLFLTPSDYGILSVTTAFSGVVSILFLQSMESVFNRFYYDFKTEQERKIFYGSVWLFLMGFVLVLTLLSEGFVNTHGFIGIGSIPYSPYLRLSLWTACITSTTLLLPRAILRVKEKVWQFCGLNIMFVVFNVSLIAFYVGHLRQGAAGSLKGSLISSLIIAIPATIVIFRNIRFQINIGYIKRSLSYSLPLAPHMLSLWALNLSDRFILERYVELEKIGVYALGYQIASALQVIAYSATNAIGPFFYKTASSNPDPEPTLTSVATYYLVFLAWVAIGIIGIGPLLIRAISANPKYLEAGSVVPWVVIGMFARGFYFVFVMAVYYSKNVKWLPIITVFTALVNIVLNLVFVPKYGYMSAAVNSMVAFLLQAILIFYYAQKCFYLHYQYKRIIHLSVIFMTTTMFLWYLILFQGIVFLTAKVFLIFSFPLSLYFTGFFKKTELYFAFQLMQRFGYGLGNFYDKTKSIFKIS